ncbi:MAG: YceD family protein [Candidatus Binatia bacterium]
MIIRVDDVTQSPKELRFPEKTEDLNEIYAPGQIRDFHFPAFLDIDLTYYRSGADLFFQGSLHGTFEGHCSRCLRQYTFALGKQFEFVLSPDPSKSDKKIGELTRDELGLSYYSGEEIKLTPLIKEQVLLALPTRPLCEENCRGLCGSCGANLNLEACACSATADNPRMSIFRTLKVGR